MSKPTLKTLVSFKEVINSGSASGAAQILDVAQSTISKHILELEKSLGISLFHRENNNLVPTSEALLLLDKVSEILEGVDNLSALAKDVRSRKKGTLRISAPPSFVEGPLVDVLHGFRSDRPECLIHLDSRSSATVIRQVANGDVDFGFVKLPISHPELVIMPFIESGTVCVVPTSNILSNRSFLTPEDLADESLILLGSGGAFQSELRREFVRHSVPMCVNLETHSVGASCTFAKKGMGIAIVNGFLAKAYKDERVQLIPFQPNIMHSYGLVSHKTRQKSLIASAFREHVKQFTQKL
ncbi:LysR family transcriptional regulator [Kordiimonas sediminis]|uniref:LysR family transcriptional regulator n=1 Tax=Kordiimonas sediminis TaxID=1735581 RepID=A0A919AQU6_9PROT|nr:LysR family transcriptional regulator [Kordiimonas sediminis]GHF17487.1 LysR family transcriptional regulator [Kordiimonas sediminis]